jgi:hypothetical protein
MEGSATKRKGEGEGRQAQGPAKGADAFPQFRSSELQQQFVRWSSQGILQSHERLVAHLECHRKLVDALQAISRDAQNAAIEASRTGLKRVCADRADDGRSSPQQDAREAMVATVNCMCTCAQATASAQVRAIAAVQEYYLNAAKLAGNAWRDHA